LLLVVLIEVVTTAVALCAMMSCWHGLELRVSKTLCDGVGMQCVWCQLEWLPPACWAVDPDAPLQSLLEAF
jgi:hypothetical protein